MLQNLVVQIGANTAGLNQGVSGALTQLNRLGSNAQAVGNQINRGMASPLGSLKNLAAGFLSVSVAVGAVKEGLSIVSTMQRVDATLKAVSSSSADYARSQTFLRATADQLGLSYESLADGYKNLKAATMGTALAGSETERIFTSVVHAGAALRLSNEDVQGSLRALTQMMSTGTVQSDELKNELGNRLPGALKLMSNALGVTQKELIKMLEQGQVLASDALPKLATELEKTYGAQAQANINSMAGGWTRLTDQAKLFLAEFSKENGVDKFFAKLGNSLANYIQGLREAQNRGESLWGLTKDRRVELSRQAGMRQEFVTAQPGRRQEMLDQARFELDSYRSELKNPNLNSEQRGNINAAIVQAEERLLLLRRANINVLGREFAEQRKAEQQALSTGRAFFDLERDKKRVSELKTIIANKRENGQNYSAEQREFDILSARIEHATESVKKHKAAVEDLSLSTNERLLKRYTDAWKKYGDTAGNARSNMVRILQDAVTADKAIAGGQLQNNIQQIDLKPKITSGLSNFMSPLQGLASRFNDVKGLGSLGYYQKQIGEIESQIQGFSLRNLTIPQETIDKLTDYTGQVQKAGFALQQANQIAADKQFTPDMAIFSGNVFGGQLQVFRRTKEQLFADLQSMKEGIRSTLESTAETALTGMAAVVGGLMAGTAGVDALPNLLLDTLGGLMIQLGQIAIQTAIGIGAIQAALKTLNPVVAAVAGVALIALGTVVKSGVSNLGNKGGKMPAFANGGTMFGPTVGLMGEYPGASRNPEFVAPVNKGAGLIAQQLMQMGGFGGGSIELFGVLKGADIYLSGQRYQETRRNQGS